MNSIHKTSLSKIVRLYGKYQRQRGNYSNQTLRIFSLAKKISANSSALFDYMMFKRDLGYTPSSSILKIIILNFDQLPSRQQFLALNFLFEVGLFVELNELLTAYTNQARFHQSPVISFFAIQTNRIVSNEYSLISNIHQHQEQWRSDFKVFLNNCTKNIAIVGNSAQLKESGLGSSIDQHDIIVRFNIFPTKFTEHKHCGEKIDIWVQTPDLKLPADFPKQYIKWIVLTGPDVRFTLSNWNSLLPHLKQGTKVLTVPLETWKNLVSVLQAPPSAGVLLIAWLSELINHQRLSIIGFQTSPIVQSSYHFNKKHKASSRHNWKKEAQLLKKLRMEGLPVIGELETVIKQSGTVENEMRLQYSAAIFSSGIKSRKQLLDLLAVNKIIWKPNRFQTKPDFVVGWGRKKNTLKARKYAQTHQLPFYSLEDGFLHSAGEKAVEQEGVSVIIDKTGMYYDATQTSDLERYLLQGKARNPILIERAKYCIQTIITHNISKYNIDPYSASYPQRVSIDQLNLPDGKKILLVDQTAGDMSLEYGYVNNSTFQDMLEAALNEHPDAHILIKTHLRVNTGKKKPCLSQYDHKHKRVIVIDQQINPILLIKAVDHVYVATSQMGFEALMIGKPVTCFGVPFYAQWGITDDRGYKVSRRNRISSLEEIFVASYILYTRYIHPKTHQECEIEDILDVFIADQA